MPLNDKATIEFIVQARCNECGQDQETYWSGEDAGIYWIDVDPCSNCIAIEIEGALAEADPEG